MLFRCELSSPLELDADWLVVGLFDTDRGWPAELEGAEAAGVLERLKSTRDLPCTVGDTTPVHGNCGLKARALLAVGLGLASRFGAGEAYAVGCLVGKRLGGRLRKRVAILLPEVGDPAVIAAALVEGVTVGTQAPALLKSEMVRLPFEECLLVLPRKCADRLLEVEQALKRGKVVGEAVNLARELINTPPGEKPPTRLAARAADVAAEAGIEVDVWDSTRLEQERFGGLLGVAAGSAQPPSFVILHYRGGQDGEPATALVGKGVTFDSGGLSLKSTDSMKDMKADMSSA
jgi:leucyl aminopeptidase